MPMKDDEVLSLNRPKSWLTNPPGHLWRDKWNALSGPLSPPEPLLRVGLCEHLTNVGLFGCQGLDERWAPLL